MNPLLVVTIFSVWSRKEANAHLTWVTLFDLTRLHDVLDVVVSVVCDSVRVCLDDAPHPLVALV